MHGNLPYTTGQTIGLLGGSFDPAHAGHVHITRQALKRFGLDRVLWLVSPGNPLKSRGPAPMSQRLKAAEDIMQHPKVSVSDFEVHSGTRYTAATLRALRKTYPKARFVWLMGADNLVQFDQWQDWREIMETVPIGVLARPGDRMAARFSKAARVYKNSRIPAAQARRLGASTAPAWCFLNLPMVDQSSSAIRAAGKWKSGGAQITTVK